MLKFVSFAVKMQLNVHDLNNEAVAGNVTDIRIMEFLDENGKRTEAPAVSGRMLKHWHLEGMRKLGLEQTLPLCDSCKIGEPVRPAKLIADGKLTHQDAINEGTEKVVQQCTICDIHGYLAAIGETSERRSSRAMFSWLMPVLNIANKDTEKGVVSKQVIHSRVKSGVDFKEETFKSQMPFNKSYASGIYAFVSALDVERIGLIENNLTDDEPYAVDEDERKKRIKVAIESYRFIISGQIGASLSHALPHNNPVEILVAYSESHPLPFLVSPMYSNYIEKSIGLIPQNTTFLYWGVDTPQGVTKKQSINEIFSELLQKV